MEYMFVITADESTRTAPGPGEAGFDEMMAAWFAYNQQLVDGGHFIAGASLQPSLTATTVDLVTGAVTDGPFTETKEQVGGFYVVEATDLDQALELARAIPAPARVEVRPLAFRPFA
jgi:hypothetical protein